jgi:ankyrin repeat protein
LNLFIHGNKKYSEEFFVGENYKKLIEIIKPNDFLKLFPNLNHSDTKGNTLVNYISQEVRSTNEVEKIKLLIQMGANINQTNLEGIPPLISALTSNYAVRSPIEDAVVALVNAGANPNVHIPINNSNSLEKKSLKTALHITSASYSSRVVKILLQHGANPNSIDLNGNTPLHEAVFNRDIDVAKFLIDKGANVNKKNKEGNTPLDLSYDKYANPMIAQLLNKYRKISR